MQYLQDKVALVTGAGQGVGQGIALALAARGAKIAVTGRTLEEVGLLEEPTVPAVFVKTPVFPFSRFPGVDPVLGPEMKSTGEVMGISPSFGNAFAKSLLDT